MILAALGGCAGGYRITEPAQPLAGVPGYQALPRRPLVAIYRSEPRAPVLDAEVPRLVLYDDGLIVRHDGDGERARGVAGRIAASDARRIAAGIVTPDFLALPRRAEVSDRLHERELTIVAHVSGERWKVTSIYGLESYASRAPAAFVAAARRLLDLRPRGGWRSWQPETVEVMLGQNDHIAGGVPWPADIPVTRHLPAAHVPALRAFLAEAYTRSSVIEIDGHRYRVNLRPMVPADHYLRRARYLEPSTPRTRGSRAAEPTPRSRASSLHRRSRRALAARP